MDEPKKCEAIDCTRPAIRVVYQNGWYPWNLCQECIEQIRRSGKIVETTEGSTEAKD